jgi:hypothetical protein
MRFHAKAQRPPRLNKFHKGIFEGLYVFLPKIIFAPLAALREIGL